MKKIYFLALLFISAFSFSQLGLKDGNEWYYSMSDQTNSGFDFNRCYIDGDTVILGKSCKIYHKKHQTCDLRPLREFIYEENNRWYYYHKQYESFKLLYDFSATVGDTITVESWEHNEWVSILQGDSLFYMKIDSIDYIPFDTLMLKRFFVSYDLQDDSKIEFSPGSWRDTIIEGIGNTTSLFHGIVDGLCHDFYSVKLRCFTDADLGTLKFVNIACDTSTLGLKDKTMVLFRVSPNPVNSMLFLKDLPIQGKSISIYSQTGKLVRSINYQESINVEAIDSGMYTLLVEDQNGKKYYTRFVRE